VKIEELRSIKKPKEAIRGAHVQIIHIFVRYFANPLCGPDATKRHPEAPRRRKSSFLHKLPFAPFAKKCFLPRRGTLFQKLRL
jgi:hypothetical protein